MAVGSCSLLTRLNLCSLVLLLASVRGALSSDVGTMAWENFTLVQEGEWMMEFFAPWCPACQQFTNTWEAFADQMSGEDIKIVMVDVTVETMLSGRFMVTHLPSIYHIKDGEVRQFPGERTLLGLTSYIQDEKWKEDDVIPAWRSPTASHMYLIGTIFWFSEKAKELQVILENDYQMPTYAIFILIAVATILIGLLLGGITVCAIEICLRCCSRRAAPRKLPPSQPTKSDEKTDESSPLKGGLEDVAKNRKKEETKKSDKESSDGLRKRTVGDDK